MDKDLKSRAVTIRDFNRFYTNFIGLINQNILESPYSLAEARVLLEIDKADQCTASDLTKLLQIDPGYLSRMLTRLIREKLVIKSRSETDGRAQEISLTNLGKETFKNLSDTSTQQIVNILETIPIEQQQALINYMEGIRNVLSHQSGSSITIRTGRPGDLGYIAYRHSVLYHQEYNLDPVVFERYVLGSLLKYAENQQAGEIWIAEVNGKIAGFIGMVALDEETAQLRWFLIEPEFRGIGLGRRLLKVAMAYCNEKKYKKVLLWTFQGLDAACHLYKSFGFTATQQVENNTWKNGLLEERWEVTL
ncbi:bifunctional helix-turn-helix transcriptional regulator/GNAT family N-acetyltransferase [Sporomusa malonica]|uniref:Transcriptional regulator, MarR family with acetyltransferase activity n=1 Tax=Sporomusa malonica TaxID=112901 RepID=A0A1W2DEZ6_9FIRM|nr:helix-turn-helix domain-containing GNAT family N-acetyltransferase [Sporomusa malonica]SMC96109.1 transcriptional regulator, MarR family with acetyltransferase activity [Sporomusa malonica]